MRNVESALCRVLAAARAVAAQGWGTVLVSETEHARRIALMDELRSSLWQLDGDDDDVEEPEKARDRKRDRSQP